MSVRKQAIVLFSVLFLAYTYVHQERGWNQNSRLDLLQALLIDKTFAIDPYHQNTGDKSYHEGHYYSDKGPGIAFLALPACSIAIVLLDRVFTNVEWGPAWLLTSWIATAGSVSIITALGGVAAFLFLNRFVGQWTALATTAAVFLGSAPFPYATMLFSHAAVIGLISIALWAILEPLFLLRMTCKPSSLESKTALDVEARCSVHERRQMLRRYGLAGLCCGLAIASEYTAATAAGGVLVLAMFTSLRRGLILAAAAVPPLLLIPLYNWVCFGSPLAFGYHHLAMAEFQEMNKGLFGITFPPRGSAAYLILLSPERGLFFWTPLFLLTFAGLRPLLKTSKPLFWVSSIVIIIHVICISGYYMPSGGAALGPRHLAPILPFLTLLTAFGVQRCKVAGIILGCCSILLTGVATVIDAMPDQAIRNPVVTYYIPRITRGEFAYNIGNELGLPNFSSVCLVLMLMFAFWFWSITRKPDQPECNASTAHVTPDAGISSY